MQTIWTRPPTTLQLLPDQVDIWRVFLDHQVDSTKSAASTLSAGETQRAAKFHFEVDRARFILSHGRLRDILSRYLSCEPSSLKFSANEYGKPFLLEHDIEFNLSHSGDYALIGITYKHKIGIDVERIRHDSQLESLAMRNFSSREVSEWMSLPSEQKVPAFFNGWTRKEAYVKAQGLGLSLPLDSFDVSLAPNEPAALRATRPDSQEAARWTLISLEVDSLYAGALAVEGTGLEMRYWDWEIIP